MAALMEVDSDNGLLGKLAAGGDVDSSTWPSLREQMIEQLDKIARNEFPIPSLPPPIDPRTRLLSPLPSSPIEQSSSQEANKENAPTSETPRRPSPPQPAPQHLEPGELPKQIDTMLAGIIDHLKTFETNPPHTIQRLSELVLRPKAHYKALAPYLHAVDRVVHVTSSTKIYPLPPAIPDMASMTLNGEADPASAVNWSNPTNGSLAADEALGGALLTPIPWLNRRSPDSNNGETASSSGSNSGAGAGAQIHSESTETIEGPNGVGSIETVSVSVNGVPSTGHARGVTQGELLRQEQRAGVVPVSQLARHNGGGTGAGGSMHDQQSSEAASASRGEAGEGDEAGEDVEGDGEEKVGNPDGVVEDEPPHARGPDEIGAGDIGPQSVSTSFVGEGGLDSHDIDVEAAVGRKHDSEDLGAGTLVVEGETAKADDETESVAGTKRSVDEDEETEDEGKAKKLKEEDEGEGEKMDTEMST